MLIALRPICMRCLISVRMIPHPRLLFYLISWLSQLISTALGPAAAGIVVVGPRSLYVSGEGVLLTFCQERHRPSAILRVSHGGGSSVRVGARTTMLSGSSIFTMLHSHSLGISLKRSKGEETQTPGTWVEDLETYLDIDTVQ